MVYAYAFEEGQLELTLDYYAIDGEGGSVSSSSRSFSLESWSDVDWDFVELEGTVRLPPDLQEEVFPDDELPSPPSRLVVVVDCPDTHHRFGVEEIPDPEEGENEFETTLERDDVYGEVRLRPFLVRTEEGNQSGFAQVVGQKVADGRPFKIEFDEVTTPGDRFMDVEFKSFEDSQTLPEENLYHLRRRDLKVLVNEDHGLISKVFESEGHSGFRPYLRESLSSWIAKDVKVELVLWAITGFEGGEFDESWQQGILEAYGPELYEHLDADSPGELYALYRGEEGDDPHYLVNTIEKVVQRDTNITEPLTKFIEKQGPDYLSGGE